MPPTAAKHIHIFNPLILQLLARELQALPKDPGKSLVANYHESIRFVSIFLIISTHKLGAVLFAMYVSLWKDGVEESFHLTIFTFWVKLINQAI